MNKLPRFTPLEARKWVENENPEAFSLKGTWDTRSEELPEKYVDELKHAVDSIRNNCIVCLVEEEPVFEINRILREVEDFDPVFAAALQRIDSCRDAIVETLEKMIHSGIWNYSTFTSVEKGPIAVQELGMRLAQYKVMTELSSGILGVFSHFETVIYSSFIAQHKIETDEGSDEFLESVLSRIETEQGLICCWIEGTLNASLK